MRTQIQEAKSELRSDLLRQLNQISADQKNQWSLSIQNNLKEILKQESGPWAAFQNLKSEPEINWSEVSDQIQWCFPIVEQDQLHFKKQTSQFCKSKLQVLEPLDGHAVSIQELKGVIAPGLAFSHKGHRLGRGKAFYDRAFQNYNEKKIAVCFGISLLKEIPYEDHDICFHQIITESSIYQVEHSEGDTKWN